MFTCFRCWLRFWVREYWSTVGGGVLYVERGWLFLSTIRSRVIIMDRLIWSAAAWLNTRTAIIRSSSADRLLTLEQSVSEWVCLFCLLTVCFPSTFGLLRPSVRGATVALRSVVDPVLWFNESIRSFQLAPNVFWVFLSFNLLKTSLPVTIVSSYFYFVNHWVTEPSSTTFRFSRNHE